MVGPRQVGFYRRPRGICPVVQQMSEPCEFEFVPMKRAVRDSVAQIGNHTSKSEASIQSETALNAGETGEFFDGSIGSKTSKGTQRCMILLDTRTSSRRRLQYQEGKELRKYWKNPIIASVLHCCSNCKIGSLQDHGHTPLQDGGSSPLMDLVTGLQTRRH